MKNILTYQGNKTKLIEYISKNMTDYLVDEKAPDAAVLKYLAYSEDKIEKMLENPKLFKTPIVRNGKQATIGYCPEIWEKWE